MLKTVKDKNQNCDRNCAHETVSHTKVSHLSKSNLSNGILIKIKVVESIQLEPKIALLFLQSYFAIYSLANF